MQRISVTFLKVDFVDSEAVDSQGGEPINPRHVLIGLTFTKRATLCIF